MTEISPKENQPWIINRIFEKRHWCNQWLTQLCHTDDKLFFHIAMQDANYPHFLAIIKIGLEKYPQKLDLNQQASLIRESNKKRLIKQLLGCYPPGLLNVLRKLGTRPLSRTRYQLLIDVLQHSSPYKNILHVKRLHPASLEYLNYYPKEVRKCPIALEIIRQDEADGFLYMIRVILRFRKDLTIKDVASSLCKVKEKRNLFAWYTRRMDMVAFPAPVWVGNEWIHPVASREELFRLSNKYRNCIHHFHMEIITEKNYFYEACVDATPCIIKLTNDCCLGWVLEDIKGPHNNDINKKLSLKIELMFSEQGIFTGSYTWSTYEIDLESIFSPRN